MRNRRFLERIDGHLARWDERWASIDGHLARSDERWASIDGHLARWNERWASIDGHLARSDERWASIDQEIRLTREEIRLTREQHDRHAEMFADLRVFTRDVMLRMERVTSEQVSVLRDLREESAAHRQALLRLLDRIGPDDSPSAA